MHITFDMGDGVATVPIRPRAFQRAPIPRHFNKGFIETAEVQWMLATLDKTKFLYNRYLQPCKTACVLVPRLPKSSGNPESAQHF